VPLGEPASPAPELAPEPPDRTGFHLKARILGALALAATGIPCLHVAAAEVRRAGGSELTATAGAWLALALVVYLPLYIDGAAWPGRSAQGSCFWVGGALAWCLADLGQRHFGTELWPGFFVLALVGVPLWGWLLRRWLAPPDPFRIGDWLFGVLPGGLFAAAFAIGAYFVSAALSGMLEKVGPAFAAVVEVLPACGALLGLQIGLNSATTPPDSADPYVGS
jgi:hypothetical protein